MAKKTVKKKAKKPSAKSNKPTNTSKGKKKPTTKVVRSASKKQPKTTVNKNSESTKKEVQKKTNISLKNYKNLENRRRLVAVSLGLLAITVLLLASFVGIPYIYDQTDTAEQEKDKKALEQEREKIAAEWDSETNAITGKVDATMKTNFGEIKIELKPEAAPKSVENFQRLAYRGKYDETIFHRMVDVEDFVVLQGGDYNGMGGQSAFGAKFEDELWVAGKEPQEAESEGYQIQYLGDPVPEFGDPSLYKDLIYVDEFKYWKVTYKKGLIIMANAGPNTNGSQFFITLEDTILPANYTVFGVVQEDSLSVLDKINEEVYPVTEGEKASDGAPSAEIKIEKVELS